MNEMMLLVPILVPVAAAILVLLVGRSSHGVRSFLTILGTGAAGAVLAILLGKSMGTNELKLTLTWAPPFMFSLRMYALSAWIVTAAAGFCFLVAIYVWRQMNGHHHAAQFCIYLLLTLAMTAGALLADNLVVLLFFWEGMLLTQLAMIAIGRPGAWKTAFKAFLILGATDLCMMGGIVLTGMHAHTLQISAINHLAADGIGALAMVLLIIGATAKAGSMPFHSWIPDAALDAPLPFMALLPGSLEKLIGIYFLTRICLDMYQLSAESWLSTLLMVMGAATILLAVAMALVQKNYKRLLSYHAISQVGYMVLGIGTAVPAGIIGGIFHMVNNALYKDCLFLTAGSVEKQTGTADLRELGGLASKMPITCLCFVVAALSISGFPLTNGFYSKELLYDGALERGMPYYLAAVVGTFLTSASFLKLGHAAYFGKRNSKFDSVRESSFSMLFPMIVLAAVCVLFGPGNSFALRGFIQPSLANVAQGHDFSALLPHNWNLAGIACLAILLAIINHAIGAWKYGGGVHAVDHIHHAPVLSFIYDGAEKRWFDPYDIARRVVGVLAIIGWGLDRAIDWIVSVFSTRTVQTGSWLLAAANNGRYGGYVVWCLAGAAAIIAFLIKTK